MALDKNISPPPSMAIDRLQKNKVRLLLSSKRSGAGIRATNATNETDATNATPLKSMNYVVITAIVVDYHDKRRRRRQRTQRSVDKTKNGGRDQITLDGSRWLSTALDGPRQKHLAPPSTTIDKLRKNKVRLLLSSKRSGAGIRATNGTNETDATNATPRKAMNSHRLGRHRVALVACMVSAGGLAKSGSVTTVFIISRRQGRI